MHVYDCVAVSKTATGSCQIGVERLRFRVYDVGCVALRMGIDRALQVVWHVVAVWQTATIHSCKPLHSRDVASSPPCTSNAHYSHLASTYRTICSLLVAGYGSIIPIVAIYQTARSSARRWVWQHHTCCCSLPNDKVHVIVSCRCRSAISDRSIWAAAMLSARPIKAHDCRYGLC